MEVVVLYAVDAFMIMINDYQLLLVVLKMGYRYRVYTWLK